MAQTSFLSYLSVIVGMVGCLAWRVADDELADRQVLELMSFDLVLLSSNVNL